MNRKLHNTASALMVAGTLLVLALLAQAPDDTSAQTPSPAAVAVTSTALVVADSLPSARSGRASHVRHSVAMPFFSFAPRG